MIRLPWLTRRDEGLLTRALLLPLEIPALGVAGAAALHRALYEKGWRSGRRLDCKVVSVGNLTVGGSGKTPTAAWLAGRLGARGYKTVIASRGYGRRAGEAVTVVSDGRVVRASHRERGDEPLLLASHARGSPVLVGPDRGVLGLRAIAAFGAQVLILDDGFQHHRLARDLDLVCFDGRLGLGNRRTLPRGPLRELPRVLVRADAVGVVDGPLPDDDEGLVERLAPGARRFRARRIPTRIFGLRGGGTAPASTLAGMRVGLLSGIADPQAFRRSVESLGAQVVAERHFPDHHRYRQRDLRKLGSGADVWLTTEKDGLKILPHWLQGVDLRVLAIRLGIEDEAAFLNWMEARLFPNKIA